MDVTSKMMLLAQLPRDIDDQLHRVVRTTNDAATEEKPFNIIALIKIERELHDFIGSKAGTLHIA